MVDIRKLRAAAEGALPIDPIRIFNRQPKPPGVNDLWDSQAEVLRAWHDRHRKSIDVVVKLNTGGGKTLVGLLMAQSRMNETGKGALFLCANNQLVGQTVDKAAEFQLRAIAYGSGPLPAAFHNGEAILVATYRALFHGYSKFGVARRDVPTNTSAIICDDAHTAFADLRAAFSIVVPKHEHAELYAELTARFRASADQVGQLGMFDQMTGGRELGVFEVPFWVWKNLAPGVGELLSREDRQDAAFHYQLPLLLDNLDCCHALITNVSVTITSFLPLVSMIPTFVECPNRVYMSATIADDSSLIRTFGADIEAVTHPLAPQSLAGVGERMILAPALTGIGSLKELDAAKSIAREVASHGAGVLVLVPSKPRAKPWAGTAVLRVGDQVADAVAGLTDRGANDNGPYVFPNRYDGIDLPGDACRLLVFDGVPQGSNAYDQYRATVLRGSSQIELSLAQRIEQGLGRGTRGAGDFCVVLVLGNLVDWLSRRDNLALMTSATRVQLRVGLEVSRAVRDLTDLVETVNQCLERDSEWVAYHARELAENLSALPADKAALKSAVAERAYLGYSLNGEYEQAAHVARTAAGEHNVDKLLRGWLLQLAARAEEHRGRIADSHELQTEAASLNYHLHFPPGSQLRSVLPEVDQQARNVAAEVSDYSDRRAFLTVMHDRLLPLSGVATASAFEEAVRWLGTYLGFSSDRLDRGSGKGPDNAWRTADGTVFVISCKNKKKIDGTLWKRDLEQLLIDAKWVQEQFPEFKQILTVISPSSSAAADLPLSGIRVLTASGLARLKGAVDAMLIDLANSMLERDGLEARASKLLGNFELTPEGIQANYLDNFTERKEAAN